MDDADLLNKLERVAAPPDFERRVMSELARRRDRQSDYEKL